MKFKREKGLAGIDTIIAIMALALFSTLIISMIYSNTIENVKLKKETLAMIYITEIFENVGIRSFNDEIYNTLTGNYIEITEPNVFVPPYVLKDYKVEMLATTNLENISNNENILKKVKVRLTYQAGNKNYTCSMERMKIKE